MKFLGIKCEEKLFFTYSENNEVEKFSILSINYQILVHFAIWDENSIQAQTQTEWDQKQTIINFR